MCVGSIKLSRLFNFGQKEPKIMFKMCVSSINLSRLLNFGQESLAAKREAKKLPSKNVIIEL